MEPTEGPDYYLSYYHLYLVKFHLVGFLNSIPCTIYICDINIGISLLETVVSALANGEQEKRTKLSWMIGFGIFLVGIPSALSFGIWSDITIFGKNIFDAVDFLSSNILMPLGALFISIFVSFKMENKVLEAEFL